MALNGHGSIAKVVIVSRSRSTKAIYTQVKASPFLGRNLISQVDPYQSKVVHVSLPDINYAAAIWSTFIYAGEITLSHRQSGILQKWLRALHIQSALQKSSLNIQDCSEVGHWETNTYNCGIFIISSISLTSTYIAHAGGPLRSWEWCHIFMGRLKDNVLLLNLKHYLLLSH